MVKNILFISALCFIVSSKAQIKKVHDKAKNRQFESMVFKKWDKNYFKPKWFYLLFYNKYRKGEDKRYILQTGATYGASVAEAKQVEKSKKQVKEQFDYKIIDAVDRTVNPKYNLLFKKEFDNLFNKIKSTQIEAKILTLDHPKKLKIVAEHLLIVDEFKHRLKVIKSSYSPSAEKNRNLEKLYNDMREYTEYIHRVSQKIKMKERYKKIYESNPIKL